MKPHLVLACLVTGALFGKPEGKPNVLLVAIERKKEVTNLKERE